MATGFSVSPFGRPARYSTDLIVLDGNGAIIGHTDFFTVSNGDGDTDRIPSLQVLGTGQDDAGLLLAAFTATANRAGSPTLNFAKSGSATIAVGEIVTNGEVLGSIIAFGDDGNDIESPAASIQFIVDSTPGTGDMPGRISFFTTADGGETLVENWRIKNDGTLASTAAGVAIDMGSTGSIINVGAATNDWINTGITTAGSVAIGVAGSDQGTLTLAGVTSGVVTVAVGAAAGTWTLTLPADNGDAGEQLQTNGSGVTTWEAAGSLSAFKDIRGELAPSEALDAVLDARVVKFNYKRQAEDGVRLSTTGDHETEYAGVLGDEAPWAMHHSGRIFNPVNAFGYTVGAFKAMQEKIDALETEIAAIKAA